MIAPTACPACGGAKSLTAALCFKCRYPNARSDDRSVTNMNSAERARFGCVCSFENADGKRWVVHHEGAPLEGLREACDEALALDETFRLVAYSTPYTVYQDMQGARMNGARQSHELTVSTRPTLPESVALARLGLGHLLHPRLIA